MTPQEKAKDEVRSTNPPFVRLEKAIIRAKGEMCWKDVVPFIIRVIERIQPEKETYSLKWWIKELKKL